MKRITKTDCSGCGEGIVLYDGLVRAKGKSGDAWGEDPFWQWDCPLCGYADSYWKEG